jgi:FtsZ-binding cell division protein ZapB
MISTKSMAMKVHKGAANIDVLRLEIKELNRDINSCYREMDTLRNQNMMLLEVLTDLTGDESYWSDQAKASGLVFKLTNVLTQIKSNFGQN